MSTNGMNTTEDADIDMSASDGEKVVTMMDVLQEQQDFENDAAAVLDASDDKNCTYSKGYVKRQALYACLTCCPDAKADPFKRAGVCLACSLNCHESHELIELYTKRNFRCDCGNPKFNNRHCQFTPDKNDLNYENKYNQNFVGVYCVCHRPYPDPESTEEEEMIQCIICEDWLHEKHLEATVPDYEQYAEMICKDCMEDNDFLHDYSELVINTVDKEIIVTDPDLDVDLTSIINKPTEEDKEETKTVNGTVSEDEKKHNDSDGKDIEKLDSESSDSKDNTKTENESPVIQDQPQEEKKLDGENELNSTENKPEENKSEVSDESAKIEEKSGGDNNASNATEENPPDEKIESNLQEKGDGDSPEKLDDEALEKQHEDKLLQDENGMTDTSQETKTETAEQNKVSTETSEEAKPEQSEQPAESTIEPDSTAKNETTEDDVKPDSENVTEKSNEVTNDVEMEEKSGTDEIKSSSDNEVKRKFSTEGEESDPAAKKPKVDGKPCVRPKRVKRVYKGATFWPADLRQKLCTCNECIAMYKDLAVLFLIDPEDTVTAYEALGKEIAEGPASQYEKGLQALSSLDRVQQINAMTEYNKMRDKLLDFLKSFKDRKEIVKEEDIKAFFAGMKPKREPDGVYFCR